MQSHLRNITCNLLSEVCNDVAVEPVLHHLSGEDFASPSSSVSDEARVDVKARGFWQANQIAFFDVRVFNPMAKRYANQSLDKAYRISESEKKRTHNERIIKVEHGTFTPLVFSATGGVGREAAKIYIYKYVIELF